MNGRVRVRSFQGQGGGEPIMVGVCSYIQCQKRTGSVVGLGAYFLKDSVQPVFGAFNTFVGPADSAAKLSFYFCPTCGSSIFWEGGYSRSDVRGVAVGCFADPSFPPPQIAHLPRKPALVGDPSGRRNAIRNGNHQDGNARARGKATRFLEEASLSVRLARVRLLSGYLPTE